MFVRRIRLFHIAAFALTVLAASSVAVAQKTAFTMPPPANGVEQLRLDYYAYDRDLPLDARVTPKDDGAKATRYNVNFFSAHDQRVPAVLAIPKTGTAPYPAVILMHGSGGNKNTDYIKYVGEILNGVGIATIAIDAQYHGDRKLPGTDEKLGFNGIRTRDAWVQTVIDLRRTVDYLESRSDIDKMRIGYLGFSMGAMMGADLGGVEPRICCFLLAVPGAGLVNIVKSLPAMLAKSPQLKQYVNFDVTPEAIKHVEQVANVVDPIYFVGRIKPRPLLILVAKKDEIIPPEASAAIIAAAHADPSEVKYLPGGHATSLLGAIFDIKNFFAKNLLPATPTTAAAH